MLYHKNALDLALESRDESSIEALLERGPEINEENPAGWTVLHLAASSGRGLLVRALLEKGADPHEMIPDALLEHGAQVDLCICGGGEGIRQTMARHGADTIMKLVIAQEVENSIEGGSGMNVLHVAAERGYVAVVRLLLDSGFDIATTDHSGRTSLHFAANSGHREFVKLLLSRNADALATRSSGLTALHLSAEKGLLGITGTLLRSVQSSSRNIDVRDNNGRTPMYLAIANGHTDVVRLFTEMGGDHVIKDHDGKRAAYWAGESGHWNVLRLLQLHEGRLAREGRSQDLPRDMGVRSVKSSHWSKYEAENNMVDPMILRWD